MDMIFPNHKVERNMYVQLLSICIGITLNNIGHLGKIGYYGYDMIHQQF